MRICSNFLNDSVVPKGTPVFPWAFFFYKPVVPIGTKPTKSGKQKSRQGWQVYRKDLNQKKQSPIGTTD